ncbi:MAG: DUF882 domain-containing protein [Proteobacteria bacterium]|nr:DUF882 domain-containing protein [Pseudomonadota bacterium]
MHRWLLRTALAILLGATLLTGAGAGASAARRRSGPVDRFPPLVLINVNAPGQPRLSLRLYDRRGRLQRGVARRVASFLRCHHTGKRHVIAPRLLAEAYRVFRRFGRRPLLVYSAFRDRRVARLKRSFHTRGQALDFRIEGVSNRQLRDFLLASRRNVGVGYYTGSPFVHLDVRDRPAFWVDFSGPGEPARYAAEPRAVLLAERRGIRPGALEALSLARVTPARAASKDAVAAVERRAPADTILISAAGEAIGVAGGVGRAAVARGELVAPSAQPLGPAATVIASRPRPEAGADRGGAIAPPARTPVLE